MHELLGIGRCVVYDKDTGSVINDFVVVQEQTIVSQAGGQPEDKLRRQSVHLGRILRHRVQLSTAIQLSRNRTTISYYIKTNFNRLLTKCNEKEL